MNFALPPRLIGTFTAVALGLTTLAAAPAHAEQDRTARAVSTILGLAVVGAIIHDQKKSREKEKSRANVRGSVYQVHPNSQGHGHFKPQVHHKPKPHRVSRKLLPQHCLRSFPTRHGHVRVFGQRCLERSYNFVHSLPRNCVLHVRSNHRKHTAFDARCLRQNGYRLARG